EADGNPLALMALADSVGTGGTDRGETAKPVGRDTGADRVLHMYRARVRALPAETRLGMLTAAVDSANDFAVITATMSALDVTVADLAPAELAGLLVSEGRSVSFPHPLVRSAVVSESTPDQRRAVHRALADALDPRTHADRRAWHL